MSHFADTAAALVPAASSLPAVKAALAAGVRACTAACCAGLGAKSALLAAAGKTTMLAAAAPPAPSKPSGWQNFVALLEEEWGAIETWGETEFDALLATAGTIVKSFDADAIAFVKTEVQALMTDITSGKMTLPDAATAVLNSAQAQGVTLLEGIASKALVSLIATFAAAI